MKINIEDVSIVEEEARLKQMASRIKWLRNRKGITQVEMAKRMKKSQSGYAAWESADRFPTTEIMPELAKELNTTLDYLHGLTDEWDPREESYWLSKAEENAALKLLGVTKDEAEILGEERVNMLKSYYRFQLEEAMKEYESKNT